MKQSFHFLLGLMLLLAGCASTMQKPAKGFDSEMIISKLNLTEEQRSSVQEILEEYNNNLKKLMENRMGNRGNGGRGARQSIRSQMDSERKTIRDFTDRRAKLILNPDQMITWQIALDDEENRLRNAMKSKMDRVGSGRSSGGKGMGGFDGRGGGMGF